MSRLTATSLASGPTTTSGASPRRLLEQAHSALREPIAPTCEGIFLDALSASERLGISDRQGHPIGGPSDDLLICPKPHIGPWRVDLSITDQVQPAVGIAGAGRAHVHALDIAADMAACMTNDPSRIAGVTSAGVPGGPGRSVTSREHEKSAAGGVRRAKPPRKKMTCQWQVSILLVGVGCLMGLEPTTS